MNRFVYDFKIAKKSPWELISNKNERYIFGLYIGKVQKGSNSGFLIILGPISFMFRWICKSTK